MIPVDELVYDFELMMNKVSREDHISIPLPNKIVFLNNAQISWIKNKIGQNNVYRQGYESIRKRIDDLQILKIDDRKLAVSEIPGNPYHPYKSSLKDIPDYMMYIVSYSKAKSGECEEIIYNNQIRNGELKTLYYDTNYTPSFIWRETLLTMGDDNIYVYTDGVFKILEVYLTYLRYPKKIDREGYIKPDGSRSIDENCELPYYAKQDIVDLAVKFASHGSENFQVSQAAEDRLIKNSE